MSGLNKLTSIEEREFTNWLLMSIQHRPEDFTADTHHLKDRVSGIHVWIGSGRGYIRVEQPVRTKEFRWLNRRRIWRAIFSWRIYARDNVALVLRQAYSKVPVVIEGAVGK